MTTHASLGATPRILLLGKGGQVGWELQRSLAPLGELIALGHDSTEFCADFARPEDVAATIRVINPDVIVNSAAHTAVDRAESEPEFARLLNATTPGRVAEEARKLGCWLVHYSTDYVFDGSGTTLRLEDDPTGPLSVYGQTKLEGEDLIVQSGCNYLNLRSSWVHSTRGNNFPKTMLKLASEREQLKIINDQIGAPTGADLLADVSAHVLRTVLQQPQEAERYIGTYHCVAGGETNWFEYARFVFDHARQAGHELKLKEALPISTSEYPTAAKRPLNSRLDTTKLRETFGLVLPQWQYGVARMLTEILG